MRIFKHKPSPAMIVAIAALSVSLVGTAVAGPIAEISLNKGEKKQIRKISRNISNRVSNRRITQRAPGLAVATANFSNIANAANLANTATNAQNAEDAEAVGGVPAGELTVGRSAHDVSCAGAADYTCASLTLDLPRDGRVLLISQLPMHEDQDDSKASCHLERNGDAIPNTTTTPGSLLNTTSEEGGEIANGGVTVVTDVVPDGDSTFAQVCSDVSGNPHFKNTSISAVLLGTE